MNQVKKFELKLSRKNKLPEGKLSIRASFKKSGNDQSTGCIKIGTDDDGYIKSHQIGIIYNSKRLQFNFDFIANLCKYLKSTTDNRKILTNEFGYFYDSCNE
jgi:hypothetical protein